MPKTGGIRAAGDESEHLAAGRDQVVSPDLLLDPRAQLGRLGLRPIHTRAHVDSLAARRRPRRVTLSSRNRHTAGASPRYARLGEEAGRTILRDQGPVTAYISRDAQP